MSDDHAEAEPQAAVTAGDLLRQARVAKGLHIAALATSIKVAPRKLELLESDRFDELPGATFTRALAQTICRTLKIDAAPVLALLPQPVNQGFTHMSQGLNAPFHERPGRRVPSDLSFVKSPVMMGAAVLVFASVLLYLLPAGWINGITQHNDTTSDTTSGTAAEPVLPDTSSMPPVVEPASVPEPAGAVAGSALPSAATNLTSLAPASATAAASPPAVPAAAPTGALLLSASAESWVEVIDGRGAPLISRVLQPGETVGLDGASPLRVKIGNATATQVSFKGKVIDLVPTRDNVAKLELK